MVRIGTILIVSRESVLDRSLNAFVLKKNLQTGPQDIFISSRSTSTSTDSFPSIWNNHETPRPFAGR